MSDEINNLEHENDEIVQIRSALARKEENVKIYSIGYDIFDKAMRGGLREGNLVVVVGLPGEGKTTTLTCFTMNLTNSNNSCLWFSYEEEIDDLYFKFKNMGINEDNFLCYCPKQNTSGNIEWIQDKIREGILKYGIKFVFIDHLDFIFPKKIKNTDQKRMIIKDICLELKEIALKFKIIIFLASHLNKVKGRTIELQDIAESAGPGQLADYVFAVYRNKMVDFVNGIKNEIVLDRSTLKFLKNRKTGKLEKLDFYLSKEGIIQPFIGNEEENNKDNIVKKDDDITPAEAQKIIFTEIP